MKSVVFNFKSTDQTVALKEMLMRGETPHVRVNDDDDADKSPSSSSYR